MKKIIEKKLKGFITKRLFRIRVDHDYSYSKRFKFYKNSSKHFVGNQEIGSFFSDSKNTKLSSLRHLRFRLDMHKRAQEIQQNNVNYYCGNFKQTIKWFLFIVWQNIQGNQPTVKIYFNIPSGD